MLDQHYRTIRHGLKVRLSYGRNRSAAETLRRQIVRQNPARKIVAVMLLEHLGDIVACEPVSRFLKTRDPDAFIVWGIKHAYRDLTESNPHIDATLSVHCLTERILLAQNGLFDEVIDLHFPDRFCSLCRNPLMKGQKVSGINLTNYFHHGSLLAAMSLSAGLPALDESPMVYIPENAVRKADSLKLPLNYIAISCTSNADEKNWPRGKWDSLISRISQTGIKVIEIGLAPFMAGNPHIIDFCGRLSIPESAEVIRRAKLFIGIDSGPAHLANAVRTPGVILLGRYLGFDRYNPFSGFYRDGGASIVYADGTVSSIGAERVFDQSMHDLSRT